jgi:hypothetical protein
MPDALERARRYRDRAAECQALADAVQSAELKDHYRAIAASYIALAEAEETIIQSRAIISDRTTASELSARPKESNARDADI